MLPSLQQDEFKWAVFQPETFFIPRFAVLHVGPTKIKAAIGFPVNFVVPEGEAVGCYFHAVAVSETNNVTDLQVRRFHDYHGVLQVNLAYH